MCCQARAPVGISEGTARGSEVDARWKIALRHDPIHQVPPRHAGTRAQVPHAPPPQVDLGAVIWKLMSDGGYAHSAELLQALPPDAAASAQALRERFA